MKKLRHWLAGVAIGVIIPVMLALGLPILKGLNLQPAMEKYYRAMALPVPAIMLDILLSFIYTALLLWAAHYAAHNSEKSYVKWLYSCGVIVGVAATCLVIFPVSFASAARVDVTSTFTMGSIATGGYIMMLIYLLKNKKARPSA